MKSERYLFRGKTDPMREGEPSYWAVGSYYEGSNGETLILKKDCESEVYVIASSVGQCTGLRDKNGTLIWEGDILRHYKNLNSGVVTWDQKANGGMGGWGMFHPLNEFEINGTIHDNPELLSGSGK